MKSPAAFVALVVAALVLVLAACGSSKPADVGNSSSAVASTGTVSPRTEASGSAVPHRDAEGDSDDPTGAYYDSDDSEILTFGHEADAAEVRAVAALVTRYYAAAAADNGAAACELLYPVLAEAQAEEYDRGAAPTRSGCAAEMSKYFATFHARVREELGKLAVGPVRVEGVHGYALIGPGNGVRPRRHIGIKREGGVWKINELLDSNLP